MSIQLASVSKSFDAHKALNSVSLSIEDGTFFVVLGPSGCGKSTLLRAIAGLEPVDAGEIKLSGQAVAGKGLHLPPEQRQVGVVFQSYALWPHMNVAANVAFPLETAGETRSAVTARVAECLETVALTPFRQRKPAELSGGQRQRVALARCLAQGARTVLMDEPLANLDPHLRSTMEEELAAFHRASDATTLFITHDQREAMALADKVAVMWDGSILQADDPDTLYRRPNSKKVAGFIGAAPSFRWMCCELKTARRKCASAMSSRSSIVQTKQVRAQQRCCSGRNIWCSQRALPASRQRSNGRSTGVAIGKSSSVSKAFRNRFSWCFTERRNLASSCSSISCADGCCRSEFCSLLSSCVKRSADPG